VVSPDSGNVAGNGSKRLARPHGASQGRLIRDRRSSGSGGRPRRQIPSPPLRRELLDLVHRLAAARQAGGVIRGWARGHRILVAVPGVVADGRAGGVMYRVDPRLGVRLMSLNFSVGYLGSSAWGSCPHQTLRRSSAIACRSRPVIAKLAEQRTQIDSTRAVFRTLATLTRFRGNHSESHGRQTSGHPRQRPAIIRH